MTDALTFSKPHKDTAKAQIAVADCGEIARFSGGTADKRYDFFQTVDAGFRDFFTDKIYLSSLTLDDKIIDACVEHVLGGGARLIADASRTLEEVGQFDVKTGGSPILFLHRLGLLTNNFVAGGVYLDKDDADLMVQENAALILTPSFDAGRGHGIPPLRMYLDRGLKILLGTMDGLFNPQNSVAFESQALRLLANGSMCGEVIKEKKIGRLLSASL